jgi:DNA-binding NtrC family response regulator
MLRLIPVRVIVIDDEEAVGRRVGTWLREATCDVVTFTRAADALQHARLAPAQLALVDLHLADADSLELISALRNAAPAMRIVALAAFPEPRQIVAAVRAGAADLLEKPVQHEALLAALARQLAASGIVVRSEQEFNQRLGARLRALRVQSERTLAELSESCGLTVGQLSQIELGKSGTTTWGLARICAALGLPLQRLLAEL